MFEPTDEARQSGEERQHAFSGSNILVFDTEGTPTQLFPSDEPLLTSAKFAWTGILVEEHHLPPVEFSGRTADAHLIAMHFRTATLEWFLGGHPETRRMTFGSLDIIPKGTPLGGHSKDETEFLMLALDPSIVERIAAELNAPRPVELIRSLGVRDPQIMHIALALKAELEADCPSGRLYVDALGLALGAHLLSNYAVHTINHRHNALLPTHKLRRVIKYINDNLTEDLTLSEIAGVVHMNPFYFSRAFKESTGIPPHRYVISCRVEKAKELLTDDELPLVEVGLSVGLRNQSHFTTLFHKLTGLTPKAYRDGVSSKSRLP